jgi:outer membrane protein OmpA-like peptidoglycan-associated protein
MSIRICNLVCALIFCLISSAQETTALNKSSDEEQLIELISGLDSASKAILLEELEGFEKHDQLDPVTFELSPSTLSLLQQEDESVLNNPSKAQQDDITSEILRLLKANNIKLNLLQEEVDEIRIEQQRQFEIQQAQINRNLQDQIDDLKQLLVSDGDVSHVQPKVQKLIENLPDRIGIEFRSGSTHLNTGSVWMVNEVVSLLAHHPDLTILITGRADRSGNESANLKLSKDRAVKVRRLVLDSGINSDRVVLNYFGDRDSPTENPSDRRVDIDFIQN